jgi:hypothetical protein
MAGKGGIGLQTKTILDLYVVVCRVAAALRGERGVRLQPQACIFVERRRRRRRRRRGVVIEQDAARS